MKKLSSYKNYNDWVSSVLQSGKFCADSFLKESLNQFNQHGDLATLLISLRHIAQAKGGITQLSKKTKISRESLYKILSKNGNPTLSTFKTLLDALGYKMTVGRSVSRRGG